MGTVGSTIYGHCRRLLIRYNAENRVHNFIEKGELPRAPRHKVKNKMEDVPLSREVLEDIHCKNEQLNEYLKKVYLTSTSEIIGTPAKTLRPKPRKEDEVLKKTLFYEPEKAKSGYCTLTNVVEILLNFQDDSEKWNVNAIAIKFDLNRRDVFNLVMYYSLFTIEKFEFMNQTKAEEEAEKFQFEKFTQLEKKPLRHIESK